MQRQIKPTKVGVMKYPSAEKQNYFMGNCETLTTTSDRSRTPGYAAQAGVAAWPVKSQAEKVENPSTTTRWLGKCSPPLACKLKMVYAFKLAPRQVDSGMTGPQQDNIIIHERPKVENAVMSPRAAEKPTTR